MNEIDKRIVGYLERAAEIIIQLGILSDTQTVEIAKMIQREELDKEGVE